MFRAIGNFFARIFRWFLAPFAAFGRWYTHRGWILRLSVGAIIVLFIGFNAYFMVQTQIWTGFNPDYVAAYEFDKRQTSAGARLASTGATTETAAATCTPSAIAEVTADLIDFNVDDNAWISSMLFYKLGFFGIDWDRTPFFDNKASFQRGVNQAVRRTSVELVDTLGRVRGTSQIDGDLQRARENIQFSEDAWYFGLNPFGPKTPTPSFYRTAGQSLRNFNARLERCDAVFDARADNLMQFLDRIAGDIGSTSAILRERSENHNGGWFDFRADDRFWFAYGQLYGYYGLLNAARADFRDVIAQRSLHTLWDDTEQQFRSALNITPFIISNGREAGWIMPTHLATMGFYILRARSNLVELRQVLDR